MTHKRRPDGEHGSVSSGASNTTSKSRVAHKNDSDNHDSSQSPSAEPKGRSGADEGAPAGKMVDDEELMGEDEAAMDDATHDMPKDGESPSAATGGRHIHPCICDLTKRQREKIDGYLRHRRVMQKKFEKRVKEIEEELARLEEERLERERELQEQQELFGDEYELVGKKRKRKKRSARRASMVSLGVKQVINWKKEPRIKVEPTRASKLRSEYSSYCGRVEFPLSPITEIDYKKEPEVAIRATVTSSARAKVNIEKKENLIKNEDKRKIFETPYYV